MTAPLASRPRILFFAEAVTLAHVARPVTLAQSLPPPDFETHLASDDRYSKLFPDLSLTHHAIHSIPSAQFTRALATGSPIYHVDELRRYIDDDRRVIQAVKPDLIVGDFRLSLSVSAAVERVPYAALANAYWSPLAQRTRYPMPDHPLNAIVGRTLGGWLFNLFRPVAFARYARPINRLRAEHGLPSLGTDLRNVYTHGDHTLYCDLAGSCGIMQLPANHHFIGPVLWSPKAPPPPWWDKLPIGRPIVYVTLGSSGDARRLPKILASVAALNVNVIVASAGAAVANPPANVFISDYLPGDAACRRAALVICNGGSPTTQQALAAGVPVIGVPGNLDQHLNMEEVTRRGAGVTVVMSLGFEKNLQAAADRTLNDTALKSAAQRMAAEIADADSAKLFPQWLRSTLRLAQPIA